ncbi:MAG: alpha/beta fold hydrolase [Planctomycetes bacterium]|nr:alpha/beta fold hydrolase [Planctomycetota bacterium]
MKKPPFLTITLGTGVMAFSVRVSLSRALRRSPFIWYAGGLPRFRLQWGIRGRGDLISRLGTDRIGFIDSGGIAMAVLSLTAIGKRLAVVVACSASSVIVTGCIRNDPVEPLTTARVNSLLNLVVFNPQVGCEELQKRFDVENLTLVDQPSEAGMEYEEAYITTLDGNRLRTWYLPSRLDRGLVVFSMGAVGSMPCYLYPIRILIANGWSVVLYDYRGFGGSSGVPDVSALAPDLGVVMDWSLQRTGREKATLMGVSLGTIPSVSIAVERPDVVNGIVLDSPVVLSMEGVRFAPLLGSWADQVGAFMPVELLSEQLIGNVAAPTLFFEHGDDKLTPPSMVGLLYSLAREPKRLVTFDGLGHARGVYHDTDRYAIALEAFLSQVWEGRDLTTSVIVPAE